MVCYVVVSLWIRPGREAEYEAYEHKVARIMARHGGAVERVIRVSIPELSGSDEPFEIHVLRFPTRMSFEAFQDDAERHALSSDRADIVTRTAISVGVPRLVADDSL